MALWMVRAGRKGENEQHFLETSRIYVTWLGFKIDASSFTRRAQLLDPLKRMYPNWKERHYAQSAGQMWTFCNRMKPGDWVVLPTKLKPSIHVAEITGQYVFDVSAEDPYYHYRTVKWIACDVPRSIFEPDLLGSFRAKQAICQIKRNDAERRVRALGEGGWKSKLGGDWVQLS